MKHLIYITLCGLILFSSCDKLFLGVDGTDAKIQGKWQMEEHDTVYYNFQNNLFEYQVYLNGQMKVTYGYYTFMGDTAIKLELYAIQSNYDWNYLPVGFEPSSVIGTDSLVQNFRIKKVDKKHLSLSNSSKTYNFRKF